MSQNLTLLSKELVSEEYCRALQKDLEQAAVCRFLIAYVSGEGLERIGKPRLSRPLRDSRSFGVASLSCSCGYEPLTDFQAALGNDVRLKYFLDPIVKDGDAAGEITLFHSKIVYLWLEKERKSVIYLGSHNWTARALGPNHPRNVEASLRIEMGFSEDDLVGQGNGLAAEVNRHLLDAWNAAPCLPATNANISIFREWYLKGCGRVRGGALDQVTILLAVRASTEPAQWQSLEGRGIYLQIYNEDEGGLILDGGEKIFIMVWESEEALKRADQPMLLHCRISTFKAGINALRRGTNQAATPIEGFRAIVLDSTAQASNDETRKRPWIEVWSRRRVSVYDFIFPTSQTRSSDVDGTGDPRYQFYLEVEHVIFPADPPQPVRPRHVWDRESFAVAESKESARIEKKPGYYVEPSVQARIMHFFTHVLEINPDAAKVLPVSGSFDAKLGKRVSTHPLHDTFVGKNIREKGEDFYLKTEPQALVVNLDDEESANGLERAEPLTRIQRVFTMPVANLLQRWSAFRQNLL